MGQEVHARMHYHCMGIWALLWKLLSESINKKMLAGGLRDDPVTKTLRSQGMEFWLFPSSENQIPHAYLRVYLSQPKNLKTTRMTEDPTCHNKDPVQPNKYFLKVFYANFTSYMPSLTCSLILHLSS